MLIRMALFILMAVGLAGFGTVAWLSTRPPGDPAAEAAPPPADVKLLAFATSLRPGVLLKPDDLTTAVVAQSAAPASARPDTPTTRAELLGAMVRRTVAAGDVLLPADVMRAGDRGFLASVLGAGMRAVTVGVDAVSGTAGLIWPGDHVDLILTANIDDAAAPIGHRIAGQTVLHNIRVIAIDQELMQGATQGMTPGNNSAQGRTVTLEVSPEDAERVAVASRLGHLSLSVISAEPMAATVASGTARPEVTWGGDVSAALQTGRRDDPVTNTLRLFEGSADGKEFHFK